MWAPVSTLDASSSAVTNHSSRINAGDLATNCKKRLPNADLGLQVLSFPLTSRFSPGNHRSGAVLILAALLLVPFLACCAFVVDLAYFDLARSELQRSADAAAMAAAWELLDDSRLKGESYMVDVTRASREVAMTYAGMNQVCGSSPLVDRNLNNSNPHEDIVIGYLSNPEDQSESLSYGDPSRYNTVRVRVQRTEARNGAVPFFFARFMGISGMPTAAEAAASFKDGVTGFRVTEQTGNAGLLPFVVKIEDWEAVLSGSGDDQWTIDSQTHTVLSGSDQIRELRLFPDTRSGASGVTPGNFGTVDIGDPVEDTERIMRQIREGMTADDFAWHGGALELDPESGTLQLNGSTGISAGMREALPEIIGQPRSVLLYRDVVNPGDGANFTIVGFAGVRVMDFNLQGAASNKYISIQPTLVTDNTVITTLGPHSSYYLYQRVRLVR